MLFNSEIDICIKIVKSRTFCKITNIKNTSIMLVVFNLIFVDLVSKLHHI